MSAFAGYLWAFVSVLGFGSNMSVVAKYDAGDGMFFQLMLCMGTWCTGLVVYILRGAPSFYPWALAGGAVWCTGNCLSVYIIQCIGLGPGLVTWGTAALVVGWLTGFFGLFGLPSDQKCLESPALNVLGLALAIVALVDSTLIRKEAAAPRQPAEPLCGEERQESARSGVVEALNVDAPRPVAGGFASRSRTKGYIACLFAGCCFGSNFLPTTWIQDHVAGSSKNGLDYVFNQFCGILAASIVYFLIYCAAMGNKPFINREIVLPGFLSGVVWGVAQTGWFVANVDLGYSAAFPIIVIGPGFVGCLWSVLLFKDIKGRRNFVLLAVYFLFAVASCACIVQSRKSTPECEG